jgi:hypothetical protein
VTVAGEYSLADDTYAKWLEQLSDRKFEGITPQLGANIVAFYSDPTAAIDTKKSRADRQKLEADLDQLKTLSLTPVRAADQQSDPSPSSNSPAMCSASQ